MSDENFAVILEDLKNAMENSNDKSRKVDGIIIVAEDSIGEKSERLLKEWFRNTKRAYKNGNLSASREAMMADAFGEEWYKTIHDKWREDRNKKMCNSSSNTNAPKKTKKSRKVTANIDGVPLYNFKLIYKIAKQYKDENGNLPGLNYIYKGKNGKKYKIGESLLRIYKNYCGDNKKTKQYDDKARKGKMDMDALNDRIAKAEKLFENDEDKEYYNQFTLP